MEGWKGDLLKAAVMICVVAAEYYAMQPYHEPMLAKVWLYWCAICRRFAALFGRLALHAEYNYYTVVGAW